jgi:uncharacterized protein
VEDLRARLNDDLKAAMRAHDEIRRETIRYLNAALKNAEIAAMRPLASAEVEAVLVAQIKQRRDSIDQFKAANRTDLAAKEESELAVLTAYLPAAPADDEVEAAIHEAVRATGAVGPQDMGKVVRLVLDRYPGRVDGKLVASRVREALSTQPR